jgi:hypothetical protein
VGVDQPGQGDLARAVEQLVGLEIGRRLTDMLDQVVLHD